MADEELMQSDEAGDIIPEDDGSREEQRTHLGLNKAYGGDIVSLKKGHAKVEFSTSKEMSVDPLHMVHNGFIFGSASYAAILAVNEPNVVIAEAHVRFLSAVTIGKKIVFEATSSHTTTRSRDIKVKGMQGDIKIFEGDFKTVILDRHPLRLKLTE